MSSEIKVSASEGAQAAARDITNHTTVVNLPESLGRPLTQQERSELNKKVQQLAEEYGQIGWKTWRFLHNTIGVENIEAMRLGQRDIARTILDLMLEVAALKRAQGSASNEEMTDDLRSELIKVQQALQLNTARWAYESRRASEAVANSDRLKAAAAVTEQLLVKSRADCRSLELSVKSLCTRSYWLAGLLCLTSVLLATITYVSQEQAKRVDAMGARLSLCSFDGRAYPIGSVIDGRPSMECIEGGDGFSTWQPMATKPTRKAG